MTDAIRRLITEYFTIGIALAIGFHALFCGVDGYEFDIGYLACIVVIWPPLVARLLNDNHPTRTSIRQAV